MKLGWLGILIVIALVWFGCNWAHKNRAAMASSG